MQLLVVFILCCLGPRSLAAVVFLSSFGLKTGSTPCNLQPLVRPNAVHPEMLSQLLHARFQKYLDEHHAARVALHLRCMCATQTLSRIRMEVQKHLFLQTAHAFTRKHSSQYSVPSSSRSGRDVLVSNFDQGRFILLRAYVMRNLWFEAQVIF